MYCMHPMFAPHSFNLYTIYDQPFLPAPTTMTRHTDVPGSLVFIPQCGHIVVPDDPATKAAKLAIARRHAAEEQHARAMRNAAKNAARLQAQEDRRQQQLLIQQQQQQMQQHMQQQQQQQLYMQEDAIHSYKPKTTFVSVSSQSPYGAPAAHFAPMTISTPQNLYAPQSPGPISYDPRGSVFMPNGPLPPAMQTTYSRQIHAFADEQPQNFGTAISYHTEANSFAKIKI